MVSLILVWHSIASLPFIKQAEMEVLRHRSPAFKAFTYTEHLSSFPWAVNSLYSPPLELFLNCREGFSSATSWAAISLSSWNGTHILSSYWKCGVLDVEGQISEISIEGGHNLGWALLIWLWCQAAAHVAECWLYSHKTQTYYPGSMWDHTYPEAQEGKGP